MSELEPEHIDFEDESQGRNGISRLGAAAMGLAMGLATFESATAFFHFLVKNHGWVGNYTLGNQVEGIALFGIGSAIAMGRFIYNDINKPGEQ